MDLWLKITNVVTVGNIGGFFFLLSAIVLGYYKLRRLIAKQHHDFLAYVATLTEEQTAHIEACIHKLPEHPENSNNVQDTNHQGASQQPHDQGASG